MKHRITYGLAAILCLSASAVFSGGCASTTDPGEDLPVFEAISEGQADEEISHLAPESYVGSYTRSPSCALCGNFKVEVKKVPGSCDAFSFDGDLQQAALICSSVGCGEVRSFRDACIDRPGQGQYDATAYIGCCQ